MRASSRTRGCDRRASIVRPVRELDLRNHGPPRDGVSERPLLIVDERVRRLAQLDIVGLVWQDTSGFGQYIYDPALD